jgi:type I restriction enzyme R subunit
MAELLKEVNKEKKSFKDLGITYEEKAFYDILKSVAEQYGFLDEYTEEQYIALAKDVKEVVDDKTQYIDWDKKADIKAQLKVQIILTLAKHKYPPATRDEVFRAIFEQAENFKKNKTSDLDDDTPSIPMVPYYGYEEGTGYSMAAESFEDDK